MDLAGGDFTRSSNTITLPSILQYPSIEDAAVMSDDVHYSSKVSSPYLLATDSHERRVKFPKYLIEKAKRQEKEFHFMSFIIQEQPGSLRRDTD